MESAEIARRFLAYFEQQGHTIVPSASLVADDPTVLFVIAAVAFVVNSGIENPRETLTALGLILLGIPAYFIWRKPGATAVS